MSELVLRLFGPFNARLGDQPLSHFRTNKVQALLIYLTVEPPVAHTREQLMELLWPGLPLESAQVNLRQIVYQLRKQIPEVNGVELVLAERNTVQRNPAAAVSVDASDFAALVARVRRHDHSDVLACPDCRGRLEQAAALYQGTFLADFYLDDSNEFEDWAREHRETYRRRMTDTLSTLAEINLRQGDYRHAQAYARRQLAIDDLDERAYRQLMEALARNGQRQEALAAYDEVSRLLRNELGMSPSNQTAKLAELIHADNLEVAAPKPAAVRGYKLLDEIGAGALGVVHRAYQPVVGREVAIKVIRPRFANNPDFIRRFETEAQTVARLEHPHIVPLYDYWREPDNAYLVMRWLRGGSLEHRLTGEPLPLQAVAGVVDQIAAALQAAHRQHIIHRDVKAANILLDDEGNAYLSDFSVARDLLTDEVPLDLSSSPETVSPEQLLKEELSPQTDQYSLGVVIYHMLTGRAAIAPNTPVNELRRHILNEPLPAAAARVPGLSPAVDDVLRRATAKKPGDRFPDMIAMARAFQRAVGAVAATARPADGSAVETEAGVVVNPYKGLRAFQESDAVTFFGREALVERLARRLDKTDGEATRFLAVVGPSGSGKSSVVKAGLLPALRAGAVAGSDNWFITEMTPGRQPLEELETALLRVAVDPPAGLLEPLAHDERGLIHVLERILPADDTARTPQLLLVIDQLEELYTLTEDDAARQHFIDSLLAALDEPGSRLRVVATLRADFYDRPLQAAGLGELLRRNTEVVLPLTPGELEAAVTQPAAQAGVRLEPGLLTAVTADVTDQPGTLPLMQYALTELFEQRDNGTMTNDAYRAIGGVSGALGRRADEIYAGLDAAGQAAARQMFLRLVTLGEGVEDTRRRALRSELEAVQMTNDELRTTNEAGGEDEVSSMAGDSEPATHHSSLVTAIDAFGRYRLLTFDRDPVTRGPTVEVAHEALLREWGELRNWLDESRADVRLQRLLASEAAAWRAASQDDSYLLHGSRLEQFDGWVETAGVTLTSEEQAYLSASLAARDRRRADEEARRQRELETARQLAETERQRAEEQAAGAAALRRRAMWLAGLLGLAAILALAAVTFARSSAANAGIAATRAAEANANAALAVENANLASTRQSEAVENADLAATRESQAAAEADFRATAEADSAAQRDVAVAREREARESYSLSLAANARQALDADDQQLALLLALAANTIENPPLESWRTLLDVAYAPGAIREYAVGSPSGAIDVSPDGRTMLTGSDDGLIRLWDIRSGEVIRTLEGHTDAVAKVLFSPDGTRALSGGWDERLILWDLATGTIERELTGHANGVNGLAFLPDGRHVLTGEDPDILPGELILWDLESGAIVRRFGSDLYEVVEGVRDLAVSPDGRTALVGYGSESAFETHPVALWDIETGEVLRYLNGTDDSVNSVAITPDGRLGLGASDDSNIYVWELSTGEIRQTLRGHEAAVLSVAVSPDGLTALSGSADGLVIHWDMALEQAIERFAGDAEPVTQVDFRDDGTAVTASAGGTARLWDLVGGWRLDRWRDPETPADQLIGMLTISPDGRYVLAETVQAGTGLDPRLALWDYETGQLIRRFDTPASLVRDIAITPDSRQALTAHNDGTLALWDLQSGQVIRQWAGHSAHAVLVEISSDGRHALSAGTTNWGELAYWDLISGQRLWRRNGHLVALDVSDARFLPGDRQAISSGGDGSLILWDLATGEQIRRLTGLEGDAGGHLAAITSNTTYVYSLAPTPDGRRVLSAGEDAALLLWDLADGRSVRRFVGHSQPAIFVALTPDGRRALSGAVDEPVILWDVATAKPIRRYPVRKHPEGRFAPGVWVHPGGESALTDDIDGSIVKWQLAEPSPEELIDWIARNRVLRELTCLERETYRIEPLCVDGQQTDTTDDMLAVARQATAALDPSPTALPEETASDPPPDFTPPVRTPKVAVLGENRGVLTRGNFDVWLYEGKADEVISVQLVADRPLTDRTIPLAKQYEAGVLDTVLSITGPDGVTFDVSVDETTTDLRRLSDARLRAIRLPEDGVYRIEARSSLDDHAGPYTLIIEQVPTVWLPEVYPDYVGHYLDGPWQWDSYIYIQDGRLYFTYYSDEATEMIPLNEADFASGASSITRMVRDSSGAVVGYEVLYSYEHAIGGQWYQGTRVGDLPPGFLEARRARDEQTP